MIRMRSVALNAVTPLWTEREIFKGPWSQTCLVPGSPVKVIRKHSRQTWDAY